MDLAEIQNYSKEESATRVRLLRQPFPCPIRRFFVRKPGVHPVESYLSSLHASLGAGTPETSGYPALSNLLNAIGETLKPKITAVIHPANNSELESMAKLLYDYWFVQYYFPLSAAKGAAYSGTARCRWGDGRLNFSLSWQSLFASRFEGQQPSSP